MTLLPEMPVTSCRYTCAPHHKHVFVVAVNLHVFLTPVPDGDAVPLSSSDRCTLEIYSPVVPTGTPYTVANISQLVS